MDYLFIHITGCQICLQLYCKHSIWYGINTYWLRFASSADPICDLCVGGTGWGYIMMRMGLCPWNTRWEDGSPRIHERSIRIEIQSNPGESSEGAKKLQKGIEREPKGYQTGTYQKGTKRVPKSIKMSQGLSKRTPCGKNIVLMPKGMHFGITLGVDLVQI